MSLDYIDRTMMHGNAETLVLAMLEQHNSWPYRMRQDLKELSKGRFTISLGRLYPMLHRLEKCGLVKMRVVVVGEVKERTVYRITAKGRKELAERTRRWHDFVKSMDWVLYPRPSPVDGPF